MFHPAAVIVSEWALFALSWLLAAFWRKSADRRLGFGRELGYRLVLIVGLIVFGIPAHGYRGPLRLWSVSWTWAWVCVGLIGLGFAFAWWARVHLGALWSGNITTKADHRVVDTGPYAIVRHPIYTGLLLSLYATMATKGTVYGVAGAAIITLGLWMKARLEETWLSTELDADAYADYRRRVPMLVPFLRPRR